jgi:hypothetical protein
MDRVGGIFYVPLANGIGDNMNKTLTFVIAFTLGAALTLLAARNG